MKRLISIITLLLLFTACTKKPTSLPKVPVLATITTTAASGITSATAISGGNIIDDGGAVITESGIIYDTTDPNMSSHKIVSGISSVIFSSNMTGLTSNKVYFIKSFARNSAGIAFGNLVTFKTGVALATVITTSASAITFTTAISGGQVLSDGGDVITERGICFDTTLTPAPTILNHIIVSGSGTGIFSASMSGLLPGVFYFVRAYAKNSAGIAYGNIIAFKTNEVLPTITTTPASAIFEITAVTGGTVTSEGVDAVYERGIVYSTSINPTIANTAVPAGSGLGTFMINLITLTGNTTYYAKGYARNSAGIRYGNQISFTTQPAGLTVIDCDGNIYHSVTIGTQIWMVENLKTTKYRDCTPIANVTDNTAWSALITGAYVNYNNDAANAAVYGRLYNWYAATDARNIAPAGWHIPSHAEWATLTAYLGGTDIWVPGGKLKEAGLAHWTTPNTNAGNSSGFTALPGGERVINNDFGRIGIAGGWWSSTANDLSTAWSRFMHYNDASASGYENNKRNGLALRCIKD